MEKKKILIADDDSKLHDLYPQYLGDAYEYLHAYNGVDALILAVDQRPDVIILDVMMPQLDGRTVCKKLKEYPATRDCRIVMVTGKDNQSDRLIGFEVGADDYLEKPCPLAALARTVQWQLRRPPG